MEISSELGDIGDIGDDSKFPPAHSILSTSRSKELAVDSESPWAAKVQIQGDEVADPTLITDPLVQQQFSGWWFGTHTLFSIINMG